TAGDLLFVGSYDSLPMSDDFILRDDRGFSTFNRSRSSFDTLTVNNFDSFGGLHFSKTYFINEGALIIRSALTKSSGYFTIANFYDHYNNIFKTSLYKLTDIDDTLWTLNVTRN